MTQTGVQIRNFQIILTSPASLENPDLPPFPEELNSGRLKKKKEFWTYINLSSTILMND